MDKSAVAAAFNRWMDDYTKDPGAYQETASMALQFLREKLDGQEPTYGDEAAAILFAYLEGGNEQG